MSAEIKAGKVAKPKKKGRIIKFIKEVRSELKKVIWPTRKQLVNYTISVLLISLMMGALIWIADAILLKVIQNTLTS
ncbi:MAG: preprotein translocase subunit SecE [Eubacteriales bacterium]|jgi:preprotein translocase subunit SecE|nr:preprotein translocase subunit SecE [Eubacteriales bacterium]